MANDVINQMMINGTTYDIGGKGVDSLSTLAANFAPIESNREEASRNYAIGDHLVANNIYYKVTAAITAGDPIVASGTGQNVTVAAVGDEIDDIKSDLTNKGDVTLLADGNNTSNIDKTVDLTGYKEIAIAVINSAGTDMYGINRISMALFKNLGSFQCGVPISGIGIFGAVKYVTDTTVRCLITDANYKYVVYGIK